MSLRELKWRLCYLKVVVDDKMKKRCSCCVLLCEEDDGFYDDDDILWGIKKKVMFYPYRGVFKRFMKSERKKKEIFRANSVFSIFVFIFSPYDVSIFPWLIHLELVKNERRRDGPRERVYIFLDICFFNWKTESYKFK